MEDPSVKLEADSFTYNPSGIARRALLTYMLAGPLIALTTLSLALGMIGLGPAFLFFLPYTYAIGAPVAAIMGLIFCIPIILTRKFRNNSWPKFLLLGPCWGGALGAAFSYLVLPKALGLGLIGGITCGTLAYFMCTKDESQL